MIVYFQDNHPVEVQIGSEILWEMYQMVMKGEAEIRIRIAYGKRGYMLCDIERLNAKRTFEALPIPPPPDTLKAPPPSGDSEEDY